MRKICIYVLLFGLLSITGCEDSNNIINSPKSIDGLSLLGLSNGRTFVYLQTDTVVTANPFTVSVSDTTCTITITGSGDDWIISEGTTKIINLKVGASSIIQNGYWTNINSQDSLIYFAAPPVLMERTLATGLSWQYYTPFYKPTGTPTYFPFYIANFGFQVVKSYSGIENIITPAGEFDTYRYDLELYTTAFGDSPVAVIAEYFVPNIGLVRQDFNNGALRSSIILANYSN